MKPRIIDDTEELLSVLQSIGTLKNGLPVQLRDWVNILGLCVWFRFDSGGAILQAGGKSRSYFDALSRGPYSVDALFGKVSAWNITRFDRETWNRRFAYLVVPTAEIALFVSGSYMLKRAGSQFGKQEEATLTRVAEHFKATGEWLSLPSGRNCATCGHGVTINEWQGETCPYCAGHLR